MHVTGRDIKEESYLLSQDEDSHNWIIVEKNVQFATTIERQDLVDALNGDLQDNLQVKDIAEKLDKHRPTVSQLLRKMLNAGEIIKGSKTGFYSLPAPN